MDPSVSQETVTKTVENDGLDRSEIGQVGLASQVTFVTNIGLNI